MLGGLGTRVSPPSLRDRHEWIRWEVKAVPLAELPPLSGSLHSPRDRSVVKGMRWGPCLCLSGHGEGKGPTETRPAVHYTRRWRRKKATGAVGRGERGKELMNGGFYYGRSPLPPHLTARRNIIIMIGLGGTTETTIPHQSAPSPIPAVWSLSLLSVSIVCRLSAPPGGEDDSLRNEAQSAAIGWKTRDGHPHPTEDLWSDNGWRRVPFAGPRRLEGLPLEMGLYGLVCGAWVGHGERSRSDCKTNPQTMRYSGRKWSGRTGRSDETGPRRLGVPSAHVPLASLTSYPSETRWPEGTGRRRGGSDTREGTRPHYHYIIIILFLMVPRLITHYTRPSHVEKEIMKGVSDETRSEVKGISIITLLLLFSLIRIISSSHIPLSFHHLCLS